MYVLLTITHWPALEKGTEQANMANNNKTALMFRLNMQENCIYKKILQA